MKLSAKTIDGMKDFEADIPETEESMNKRLDSHTRFLLTQKIMIIRSQDIFRRVYDKTKSLSAAIKAVADFVWKVREYHPKGVAMTPGEKLSRDVEKGKVSLETLEAIVKSLKAKK